jgi:hypothetical protein
MRAHARSDVQRALPIAACRQPLQAVDQDAALTGLQRLGGLQLARQQVLGEVLDRRHVLAEVGSDRLGGLVGRRPLAHGARPVRRSLCCAPSMESIGRWNGSVRRKLPLFLEQL